MTKICTSIEQSKKLLELGIDRNTVDMYWFNRHIDLTETKYELFVVDRSNKHIDFFNSYAVAVDNYEIIPAWSLSALLELMPDKISINNESYYLSFKKKCVEFRGPITCDGQKSKSFEMDNIIDAAFEMVCWLKENNKL